MDVKWDPKVGGTPPHTDAATTRDSLATRTEPSPTAPAAMEKPRTMPLPDAAQTHPSRTSAATRPSALELEVDGRKASLHTGSRASRLKAAGQALGLAASSRFRRSRGARALGVELCDEVADTIEERQELAARLKELLLAEGDLHETSAESTLRACRRLVDLMDDDGAST
jgi:hypothetical protein